jgi:hypothetical protein
MLLLLLSGNGATGNGATAAFLLPGGCRHLRLWSDSFLFRFNVPILRGLLKRLVSVGKAALLESVPYYVYSNAVHAWTMLIAPIALDLLSFFVNILDLGL